jgi:hypothetical protein
VPRIADPKLHALWRDRIRRQADSPLKIVHFCAQERLSVALFHAWKRRLRLMDLSDRRPGLPAPAAFLPVTVRVVEHPSDEPMPIEADLPNGIRLRIPTANAPLACQLIRAVVEARIHSGGSR